MSRVIIWPDIYKEQGHWLPCINLAKSLKDAGYATVEFMGIPDTQPIVQPYGFPFNTILSSIYPTGYSLENKLEPLDQRWKPAHVFPIVRGALDSVFKPPAPQVNLMISGYFTALETLLIWYKYQVPFVVITTFLRHPSDLPSLHAKTKLLYMPKAVSRAIIDSVVGPANAGMSIEDFVKPLDADNRPEIIPCAKDFDFTDADWVHRKTTSYVEPMILRSPLPPASPIMPLNIPPGQRLIYGTSGSQVQDYEFRARQFFKNLISMMQTQGMDQYTLVLAVGTKLLAQLNIEYGVDIGQSSLPPNVLLFDWVSQLDIVKAADVVFMHGGLATIKESIWEQVPIVIVPHGKDQMDNALRIKRSGVGVATEAAELTPLDLRRLLTEATSSTWIRQNLAQMQALFAAAENKSPKDSIRIIKTVLLPP
jgi:UDP-N-acetylglucosamine:LPS N-acetylglucosamine transferase